MPKKLVLCFDGTGNTFTGSNSDTNVVKLLSKLDRNDPHQYHYYQTGIGTYDINDESVNKSIFGQIKSYISQTIDQGVGTTFDSHVMAGYRFLMRYYDSGDKIYMFGFSRGAFTAKFLARMVNTVGLLCKGQEEMVPFAYRLYQRYLAGEVEDFNVAHPKKSKKKRHENNGDAAHSTAPTSRPDDDAVPLHDGHEDGACDDAARHGHRFEVARDEIEAFSDTFCRKEKVIHCGKMEETNIKVFFLGIWDCVNSVAVLERTAPVPVPVVGTAHHVRHAVAIDERRVKFKAALLAQDKEKADDNHEDIKEVWFPGAHGDVGGGWPASKDNPFDNGEEMTFWQRVKHFWTTRKNKEPGKALGADRLQLSDVPLAWMIREVELVGEQNPSAAVKWRNNLHAFKDRFAKKKKHAMKGAIHDSLALGCGTSFLRVLLWKLMEWLPFITRWELEIHGWENVRFPLNKGSTRDIPKEAVLHESLLWRLKHDDNYCPRNNQGGRQLPCLKHNHNIAECDPVDKNEHTEDCDHKTFKITRSASDIRTMT
ncbi:sporulation associated protein [Diaporthe amygdali]|uniref:sporulation associated protein n=1 Tax=Phomopsis amygdali TaxID=1214568 RepID=UPI0022FDFFE6|nr:sporulation associated protein [Diaporthe amygdali]KAJ0122550.1 sporulation associated protein [Diaporthe amygdali]